MTAVPSKGKGSSSERFRVSADVQQDLSPQEAINIIYFPVEHEPYPLHQASLDKASKSHIRRYRGVFEFLGSCPEILEVAAVLT